MFQTIQLSTCVSAQGEIVEVLRNGEVVISDGHTLYRGRPIGRGRTASERSATVGLAPAPRGLPEGGGGA